MTKQAKRVDIVTIKAIKEGSILYPDRTINSPGQAAKMVKPFLENRDREIFLVAYLNTKNEPVGIHTVSIGTVNASLVNPPEVFKAALLTNATSLLLFHNHPSGFCEPSAEDKVITKRLVEVGNLLSIKVIDHIILGEGNSFYSFKEQNLL